MPEHMKIDLPPYLKERLRKLMQKQDLEKYEVADFLDSIKDYLAEAFYDYILEKELTVSPEDADVMALIFIAQKKRAFGCY